CSQTAAVRLRDPLTDREAKPKPTTLGHSRADPVGAPETLEDVREVRRRNSDARIPHRERNVIRMPPEPDVHLATGRCVLDGVGDEIQKKLAQSRAIAHHDCLGSERKVDGYSLRLAKYQCRLVHLLHQRL